MGRAVECMAIDIKRGQRVLFVGQTGSGKTVLASTLLKSTDYVVVVDPKHMFTWGHGPRFDDVYETVAELDREWKGPAAAIYRPSIGEMRAGCPAFFQWAWNQGSILVYIDEVFDLMVGGTAGAWLTKCYKQGRQKNLSVWAGTQRPARVDLSIITEAQHFFMGLLLMDVDRRRMAEIAHPALRTIDLDEYEFAYVGPDTRKSPPKIINARNL